jgi:hydrogenase/urease accessory protein HupE
MDDPMIALVFFASHALAHDFTPGVLSLRHTGDGEYLYVWTPPVDSGAPVDVRLVFPAGCDVAPDRVRCDELDEVRFAGLDDLRVSVVVVVERGGDTRESIVTAADPRVEIGDSTALGFLLLGIEHVLGGLDHLAFVLGLLLVVGADRRIVWTITAFTLAHSLTLALAVLGVVRLSSAPVEATIALSVLLVAHEATHDRVTFTRRFPWAVALVFGLVHGLGFAGALEEIGLPRDSLASALALFNVGVEIGQLAVVLAAIGVAAVVRKLSPKLERIGPRAVAYAIGALGAFWLLERTASMLVGA